MCWVEETDQLVKHVPCKHGDLSSSLSLVSKLGMVAQTWNLCPSLVK